MPPMAIRMVFSNEIKVILFCVILTVYGKLFHSFKELLKLFTQKKGIGRIEFDHTRLVRNVDILYQLNKETNN